MLDLAFRELHSVIRVYSQMCIRDRHDAVNDVIQCAVTAYYNNGEVAVVGEDACQTLYRTEPFGLHLSLIHILIAFVTHQCAEEHDAEDNVIIKDEEISHGDSGYVGMALPENIMAYGTVIRGIRHQYHSCLLYTSITRRQAMNWDTP